MEQHFTAADVYEFLKLLIEIGGVHYVDSSHCIYRTSDRTPLGVNVGTGKNGNKQIALFVEGVKPPQNAVYLNPFVELIGRHPELDQFLTIISITPGCLVMHTMIKMAELILSKKDDANFKNAEMLSKFADKIDDKFLHELQKIRPIDAGSIAYDSSKYTAQLQSMFWVEDWITKIRGKIRKSSVTLVQDMAETIYGTDQPHSLIHKGTLPPCKKFDAIIHVFVETLSNIKHAVEPITGLDLHVDELKMHLERLPAYHKAMQWLATSTASSDKVASESAKASIANASAPWSTDIVSKASAVSPNNNFLAHAEPVGVTKNPNYNGGAVKNPSFGRFPGGGMFGVTPTVPSAFGLGGASVSPVVPSLSMTEMAGLSSMTGGMGLGYQPGMFC